MGGGTGSSDWVSFLAKDCDTCAEDGTTEYHYRSDHAQYHGGKNGLVPRVSAELERRSALREDADDAALLADLEKRRSASVRGILDEVRSEVSRQNAIWGHERNMPSFTEQFWGPLMPTPKEAQELTEEAVEWQELTWEDILFEELCEAHAEKDSIEALCTELIQSAAVIVQWVSDLRRNSS